MSRPVIGVLSLQGDVREHVQVLAGLGARPVLVRRAAELDSIDALVVPGGESTTMHRLAAAFELLEPLRAHIAEGMPALGTCAGMIVLADRIVGGAAGQETVGGLDITVRRNAFGRQVSSCETDVEISGLSGSFHAVLIRAPWVEESGPAVEVLARVGEGPATGKIVAVRQGPLLATAFHPEVTGDDRLHRLFVDEIIR